MRACANCDRYPKNTSTKALNQAVKRNAARFPADFMFQLSAIEKQEVVTNCDHLVLGDRETVPQRINLKNSDL